MTFTIGRGNELCVAAIESLSPLHDGQELATAFADMGAVWRRVTGDSQLRWVGSEKGVIHLAAAALMNALWDLYAKVEGKPLWRLLADMPPEEIVALVDWRYLRDALTPFEATAILERRWATREERIAEMAREIAPIAVTTEEHCHNAVMFKQLLQAEAIRFCQLDSCRLASINEIVAVLLMAEKFGVPVCPHAGGVGLCEYVQHIAIFDYVALSASLEDRILEYVDHLHEHFFDSVIIRNGRYVPPTAPGYSITMKPESLSAYAYPGGEAWRKSASDCGSSLR